VVNAPKGPFILAGGLIRNYSYNFWGLGFLFKTIMAYSYSKQLTSFGNFPAGKFFHFQRLQVEAFG